MQYSPREAQFFPYEAKGTFKIMEYPLSARVVKTYMYMYKSVTKLKLKDDTYTYDQLDILQEEKQFYESLYTSKNVEAEKFSHSSFFKPDNITPLSQEDKLACENPISTNECLNALKEFTSNKTPGTDCFTSEFYKFF